MEAREGENENAKLAAGCQPHSSLDKRTEKSFSLPLFLFIFETVRSCVLYVHAPWDSKGRRRKEKAGERVARPRGKGRGRKGGCVRGIEIKIWETERKGVFIHLPSSVRPIHTIAFSVEKKELGCLFVSSLLLNTHARPVSEFTKRGKKRGSVV